MAAECGGEQVSATEFQFKNISDAVKFIGAARIYGNSVERLREADAEPNSMTRATMANRALQSNKTKYLRLTPTIKFDESGKCSIVRIDGMSEAGKTEPDNVRKLAAMFNGICDEGDEDNEVTVRRDNAVTGKKIPAVYAFESMRDAGSFAEAVNIYVDNEEIADMTRAWQEQYLKTQVAANDLYRQANIEKYPEMKEYIDWHLNHINSFGHLMNFERDPERFRDEDDEARKAQMLRDMGARVWGGGSYEVRFGDESSRAEFMKRAGIETSKKSRRGSGRVGIDRIVSTKELSDQQRLLSEFGRQFGTPVIFFKGDKNLNGLHADGVTYLNVASPISHEQTFWHEAAHWMAANNRALFDEVIDAANITDAQARRYIEETGRDDLTNADAREEIVADAMKETLKNAGLLPELGRRDRSLLERVMSWLQAMMRKFFDAFHKPTGKLTTDQRNRMAERFGQVARKLVDGKGRKIFRYNSRTRTLELADGRALPTTDIEHRAGAFSTGAKYSSNKKKRRRERIGQACRVKESKEQWQGRMDGRRTRRRGEE